MDKTLNSAKGEIMDDIFLQISKMTGSSPCEVEKIFEAFAKLVNAIEDRDDDSPLIMLSDYCNEQAGK